MSDTEAGHDDRIFGELSQNSYQSDQNMVVTRANPVPRANPAQDIEVRELRIRNADLEIENSNLSAKNEDLSVKYAAVLKQLKARGKQPKSQAQKVNEAIADRVKKIVKKLVWRIHKFITCDKELKKVGTMVALDCDGVKDDLSGLDPESPEFEAIIDTFVATYGGIITSTLNEYRSTCQSRVRKVWKLRLESGKPLPTPHQLRQILKRKDIFLDDERGITSKEKQSILLWYWDELLPKTAGNGYWGMNQRYYGTISKHTLPGQPKKVCITSPTEAMTLLFYFNGYEKWFYEEECAKKKVDLDKDKQAFYTKYSDSKAGQNKWGGWGIEGRKKFKEFRDEISDARGSKKSARAEEWALKALRSEHKIDELEAKRANSRCRKRKTDSHVSEDEEEGYVSYAESLDDDVPAKKCRAGADDSDSEEDC